MVIVHIHGHCASFQYMYTMCNDQVRTISTSIISSIFQVFVFGSIQNPLAVLEYIIEYWKAYAAYHVSHRT